MRVRPALAAAMTFVATAAALVVADPALALNQVSCTVSNGYCRTPVLDLAGSNLFHLATTGAPTNKSWVLRVTDANNGVVVINPPSPIWGNANEWRTNVHSDYYAEAFCSSPCSVSVFLCDPV
ncbi:hypothetical protein, partial [Actinoplanes couchii]